MLFKREGYPEEGEIVLCTVAKIHSHAVFVDMDEYGKGGMIHISEIAPGRIRNIRDFVRDGKKVVCKVLRINLERGHIDLSLRRVNDSQRRLKVEELKQEQIAEKIVENVAAKLKLDFAKLYADLAEKVLKPYGMLHHCFTEVSRGEANLAELGVEKRAAELLEEEVRARIQAPVVSIEGTLHLHSYEPEGVELVKECFRALLKASDDDSAIALHYLGAGAYRVNVTAPDYKKAEAVLKKAIDGVQACAKGKDAVAEFARKE